MKLQGDGIVNLVSIRIYPYPSNRLYGRDGHNLTALDGLRPSRPPSVQVVEKTGNGTGTATVVRNRPAREVRVRRAPLPACSCSRDSDGELVPEDDNSPTYQRPLHTCPLAENSQEHPFPTTEEISPEPFYQPTSPRHTQPRTLKMKAVQLEHENKRLHMERDQAHAHGALVYHEFASLKRKINLKSNRAPKKRKLNVKARCLTSAEGLAEAQEADRLHLEKERKRDEAAAKRVAEEAERLKNWLALDPDAPFVGVLSSKNKSQLQDIAFTVHLPIDNKLTKENLISSINDHFDKFPSLKATPRYEQIFNSR